MATSGDRSGTPLARIKAALDDLPGWLRTIDDASLGEPLIEIRGVIDRLESVFADGVRRFDKSGEYKAEGALSVIEWLRSRCHLSGGAAAERVGWRASWRSCRKLRLPWPAGRWATSTRS